MNVIRRVTRRAARLGLVAASVGLALGWFFVLRPTSLGGPAGYVLVSGTSMDPTYRTGDLVITQRQSTYQRGDIVEFRVKNALVIHRIVGGDAANGFIVRGDNNPVEDGFRPTIDRIVGTAWVRLPGVGHLILVIRDPLPLAICSWAIASLYFLRRWGRSQREPAPGT
jgi:signal peptidase